MLRVMHIMSSGGLYGAEKATLNLVRHMRDVAFSALVFAAENKAAFAEALEKAGVPCTRFTPGLRGLPAALPRLFRVPGRPHIIHAHGYKEIAVSLLLAMRWQLPLVVTQHGFVDTSPKTRLYNRLDVAFCRLKAVKAVICVSDAIRERYLAGNVSADKLVLLKNAVPLPEKTLSSPKAEAYPKTLLYLGRLSREKGADLLVEAMGRIKNRDAVLLMAGDGPLRPELEERAAHLGLTDRIVFTGYQENTKPLFAQTDIFVLPSRTEGSPLALQEAMSHGLPAVASAVGDVPFLLHDGAGVCLLPGDAAAMPAALAAALDKLLSTPAKKLHDMGERAKQRLAAQYPFADYCAKVREVYNRVLAGGPC